MSESDQENLEGNAAESDDAADESDEETYKRATMYFRESLKTEYERWLKMKELEHPEIVDAAERRQQHEAIIRVVMDNEDLFIDKLDGLLNDD